MPVLPSVLMYRAKRIDKPHKWVTGSYCQFGSPNDVKSFIVPCNTHSLYYIEIINDTLSIVTPYTDAFGTEICTNDIVEFVVNNNLLCKGIVRFGEYSQDGSGDEYSSVKVFGFYIEITSTYCPDKRVCSCELSSTQFGCLRDYEREYSLLSRIKECDVKVIGNLFD